MILGIKDVVKLSRIIIISLCAVLVCTLFMNYHMDIVTIENGITSEQLRQFYEAQVLPGKVVCG